MTSKAMLSLHTYINKLTDADRKLEETRTEIMAKVASFLFYTGKVIRNCNPVEITRIKLYDLNYPSSPTFTSIEAFYVKDGDIYLKCGFCPYGDEKLRIDRSPSRLIDTLRSIRYEQALLLRELPRAKAQGFL